MPRTIVGHATLMQCGIYLIRIVPFVDINFKTIITVAVVDHPESVVQAGGLGVPIARFPVSIFLLERLRPDTRGSPLRFSAVLLASNQVKLTAGNHSVFRPACGK